MSGNMIIGDLVRIKEERDVMVITEVWDDLGHVSVIKNDKICYIPVHILEVVSEYR